MKKEFATFLIGIFLIPTLLFSYDLELNTSYDYFRGLPDGTWNGNNGICWAANSGVCVYDCLGIQVGGSYGLYNWDGRGNLSFRNPKRVEQQAFVTAGLFSSWQQFNAGLVYDGFYANHFSIFDLKPYIDQIRFQAGYQFCSEEVGFWGTAYLTTAHKHSIGLPIKFRAINQIHAFWSHLFDNCAKTTLWIGLPYSNSLRFHHKRAGSFIAGFSVRAPLTERLFIDGNGSYMRARHQSGIRQSRNYAASICLGITYLFGDCPCYGSTYMPLANHSNFLVDINTNL